MTHQEQLEIGAYLLGALDPRERSAFEEHLARCGACRDEVADLAGIPALLGKVSLSEIGAGLAAPDTDLAPGELRLGPGPAPFPGPGPGPGSPQPPWPRALPQPEPGPAVTGQTAPEVVHLPEPGAPAPGGVRLPKPGAAAADPPEPLVVRLPEPGGPDSGVPPPPPPMPPAAGAPGPTPAVPGPASLGAPRRTSARAAGPRPTRPAAPKPARKPITAGPFSWRHRTVLLVAAAVLAALAAIGSLAVVSVRPAPTALPTAGAGPEGRTLALAPTVAGVHGTVQIAGRGTGSLLRLSMGGVPPGQQCSLLVSGEDGTREPVATWTASYEGDVEMAAEAELAPAGIRWVGVTTPDGGVLLQARLTA